MQSPWWRQLLIGLALFLAGYFMFGGADIGKHKDEVPKTSQIKSINQLS